MFAGQKLFNASFDIFADNYQSVRPGYPDELIGDIVKVCGISEDSSLLEIGAGSGIATAQLLAKANPHIVALEPGENLAKIAQEQLGDSSKVQVVTDTFENFTAKQKFDSILSFTSFHWLSGEDTIEYVEKLLKFGGTLVVVWNSFLQHQSAVSDAIVDIYSSNLSDIYPGDNDAKTVNQSALRKVDSRVNSIVSDHRLETIFLKRYLSVYRYNAVTYPKFLATYPKIINLDDARREKFLKEISATVDKFGEISVPILSTAIICCKKSDFLRKIENESR